MPEFRIIFTDIRGVNVKAPTKEKAEQIVKDREWEYGMDCGGQVSEFVISNECFNDVLSDYHGIGDPIPWNIWYPLMIWHGMNLLYDLRFVTEGVL